MDKIERLIKERDRLSGRLCDYKYILRATIVERGNICGKAACRCKSAKNPRLHGPYKYLAHRSADGANMIFLNKRKQPYAEQGVKQYKKLIGLIYRISRINFEILRYHYEKLPERIQL
jgi:hypothetical protein